MRFVLPLTILTAILLSVSACGSSHQSEPLPAVPAQRCSATVESSGGIRSICEAELISLSGGKVECVECSQEAGVYVSREVRSFALDVERDGVYLIEAIFSGSARATIQSSAQSYPLRLQLGDSRASSSTLQSFSAYLRFTTGTNSLEISGYSGDHLVVDTISASLVPQDKYGDGPKQILEAEAPNNRLVGPRYLTKTLLSLATPQQFYECNKCSGGGLFAGYFPDNGIEITFEVSQGGLYEVTIYHKSIATDTLDVTINGGPSISWLVHPTSRATAGGGYEDLPQGQTTYDYLLTGPNSIVIIGTRSIDCVVVSPVESS
jgi:hypothetical protein